MSTPLVVSMMTEIFAALRANLGTFDLSTVGGTKRVTYAEAGQEQLPQLPPWILFSAPTPRDTYGNAAMGSYQLDGQLEWWAYAFADTLDIETRTHAALQLAHEAITAIQNAHASPLSTTLHGRLTVLLPEILDVFADGPELGGGPPFVHGRLTYQGFPDRGV